MARACVSSPRARLRHEDRHSSIESTRVRFPSDRAVRIQRGTDVPRANGAPDVGRCIMGPWNCFPSRPSALPAWT